MKISVVDQSPIFSNSNANNALLESIKLAKECDSIGLNRFWVAEHHGSNSFAGCSPEVLIPKIAAETESIRIGSGGVMLMHYSPYKIAENFRLLESLFPGRIDLGLGRAPGSDPYQAGALAYGSKTTGPEFFPTKMKDLTSFLTGEKPSSEAFETVSVTPGLGEIPEIWLLASSKQGVEYAAHFGLPMSLAYFINEDCLHLADYYREEFQPSVFSERPIVSLGIFAICADTDEEAERLSSSAALWRMNMQRGIFSTFLTTEESLKVINKDIINHSDRRTFIGSPEKIYKKLEPLLEKTKPDELKVVTICEPLVERVKSYKLLKAFFDSK
tara:strand:+ start:4341 stop:5327 length:987 start_codon:yes stop_codon:yes gene_type:complete